jgi:hypothetical protein
MHYRSSTQNNFPKISNTCLFCIKKIPELVTGTAILNGILVVHFCPRECLYSPIIPISPTIPTILRVEYELLNLTNE